MHASSQPGGRSPKSMMCTSQSKPVSETTQRTVVSFPSQIKGKKRERGDQGPDSVKRERSSKIDDSDSCVFKTENILKSEIAKITERGGLVDSEGVEKFIQLMQRYKMEKKMDLVCRSVLAGVVAATDKFDCLSQFVLLRGLPVMDEWLQDVHKGRIVDGNPKDGDKHMDEFLLVLLRALDKLPVNLQALQMCNIGKSVNHLRSHKNLDIQKKARSLVDTWKKRVEAEMNVIDTKFGTTQGGAWPSKSHLPDSSHCGNKNPGGSNDVSSKGSLTQISASKTASIKQAQGFICGTPDSLLTREDKSSSSSQSHNHSQSCSGKEDARSSTAGSMSSNRKSSCSSRHHKSSNGFSGLTGDQKDNVTGRKISLHRSSTPEKLSRSVQLIEKVDVPVVEGSSHKLIVKMPNRGHSAAQSGNGGFYEDPNNMSSRASSPVVSDKNDHFDKNVKEKSDADQSIINSDVNTESWQSNDVKDILTGSDEAEGSPAALPDEERSKAVDRKSTGMSKVVSSVSGTELKPGKLHETSFSSVNALMENGVKYFERSVSISHGDDVGMNLLASVATDEMSKSDIFSPSNSSQRNSSPIEEICVVDDTKSKSPVADGFACDQGHRNDRTDCNNSKQAVSTNTRLDSVPDIRLGESCNSVMEAKVSNSAVKIVDPKILCEISSSSLLFKGESAELKPSATALESEVGDKLREELTSSSRDLVLDEVGRDCQRRECNEGNVETKEIPVCDSVESESLNETVGFSSLKVEKHMKSTSDKTISSVVPETASKMEFDLNEGFASDDGKHGELVGFSTAGHAVSTLPFPISSVPSSFPASVTVSSAGKGPFVPPDELLRFKGEIGWKGSAATSAFRPAEPRKSLDIALTSASTSYSDISTNKNGRPVLDFDLNVADERVFEEIRDSAPDIGSMSNYTSKNALKKESSGYPSLLSSGGFDLDLNRVDESNDMGPYLSSSGHRLEQLLASNMPSSGGLQTVEVRREFDLNNGPGVDDVSVDQSMFQQSSRGSLQSQPATFNIRMNSPEIGNFPSLFLPGNCYPTGTAIPPGAPRMLAPGQFPMFPYGTTFPLPSAKYSIGSAPSIDSSYGERVFAPTVNPQLLGAAGVVSPQFSRPYMIGLPDGTNNNDGKWSKQGLDLNAGPGYMGIEGRKDPDGRSRDLL